MELQRLLIAVSAARAFDASISAWNFAPYSRLISPCTASDDWSGFAGYTKVAAITVWAASVADPNSALTTP